MRGALDNVARWVGDADPACGHARLLALLDKASEWSVPPDDVQRAGALLLALDSAVAGWADGSPGARRADVQAALDVVEPWLASRDAARGRL